MDITSLLSLAAALVLGTGIGWWLRRPRPSPQSATVTPTGGEELVPVVPPEQDPSAASLALFDVDDLSGVNRANDFDTGDRLLNAISDVLRRALPSGTALERLESGRFLVWSPESDLVKAAAAADDLRQLASTAHVDGKSGPVTRSLTVGVVATAPDESRARAILRADVALANAKRTGGNQTHALRTQPIPSLIPSRAVIEEAIETRALEYHVQPIVRLADRVPVGVESLLRWNRPDGAVLGPAGFLDTLNRLPEAGVDLFPDLAVTAARPFVKHDPPLYATFNITGAVLDGKGSNACRWLTRILEVLPPEQLVLEIVETAIIVAPERAHDLIDRLRARGVRIALDDFGTGLSNLERLCTYPIDMLKVDRAFISNLGTSGREETILSALVSLAHGLDLELIAEGVETEAQAAVLSKVGVNFGQGYLLGRPAPASEWAARISEHA